MRAHALIAAVFDCLDAHSGSGTRATRPTRLMTCSRSRCTWCVPSGKAVLMRDAIGLALLEPGGTLTPHSFQRADLRSSESLTAVSASATSALSARPRPSSCRWYPATSSPASSVRSGRPSRSSRPTISSPWAISLIPAVSASTAGGVLVVDETGFVKKGTRSAGATSTSARSHPHGSAARNCHATVT
jgi:hypothetical protein